MSLVKSPFSDHVGADSVPKKGSKGGKYDLVETPGGTPRDGSGIAPELHRDAAVTSKGPSTSGPAKTPFKDAVS